MTALVERCFCIFRRASRLRITIVLDRRFSVECHPILRQVSVLQQVSLNTFSSYNGCTGSAVGPPPPPPPPPPPGRGSKVGNKGGGWGGGEWFCIARCTCLRTKDFVTTDLFYDCAIICGYLLWQVIIRRGTHTEGSTWRPSHKGLVTTLTMQKNTLLDWLDGSRGTRGGERERGGGRVALEPPCRWGFISLLLFLFFVPRSCRFPIWVVRLTPREGFALTQIRRRHGIPQKKKSVSLPPWTTQSMLWYYFWMEFFGPWHSFRIVRCCFVFVVVG